MYPEADALKLTRAPASGDPALDSTGHSNFGFALKIRPIKDKRSVPHPCRVLCGMGGEPSPLFEDLTNRALMRFRNSKTAQSAAIDAI